MNKYRVAPAIFTVLSGVGLITTAVSSGYAALALKRDLEELKDDVAVKKSDVVKTIAKDIAIPTACATATFGCFMAARECDKKTILALSAGLGTALPKLYPDEDGKPVTKHLGVDPDIIIDPDGGLYLEPITDVMIQMTPETFKDAREKTNRNFQLRGGVASLYEFFRMLGVKKKDIKRLGIDWIKYIGWSLEWMDPDGYRWIDMVVAPINETEYGYSYIYFTPSLMPICVNPPRVVKDITHCEVEDIEGAGIVDGAADIDGFICDSINDDGCE